MPAGARTRWAMPTLHDADSVLRFFRGDDSIRIAHNRIRASAWIAEEMRRPQSMQLPALALVNRGAEHIPFHRVLRLGEARSVAQDSKGDIFRMLRMMQ